VKNNLTNPITNKNIMGQMIAIFFIQASSTIAYAVFYSGLSIFLTQNKHYSQQTSAMITGIFLSLNYFLPMIGGVIASRIITYKKLYYMGTASSLLGCLLLVQGSNLHLSLALFLMGSLANVCLSMFITQLFSAEQKTERRIAFTWNYIGMNLGFMIGYLLTGFSTISNSYHYLFALMSFMVMVSLVIAYFFIEETDAKLTSKRSNAPQIIISLFLLCALTVVIKILFDYAEIMHSFLTIISMSSLFILMNYCLKKSNADEKKNIIKFMCYSIVAIVFWTAYLLTPIAIMQLINSNAQRNIFGVTLAPQWFANINSIAILVIAPILTLLIKKKGARTSTSSYFSAGFLFAGLAFIIMYLGLNALAVNAKLPIFIILGYLISLTIGEILISPASNALIGELITEPLRGIMTGAWGMNLAIGGLLSSTIASRYILPYLNNNMLTINNSLQLQHVFLSISIMLFIFMIISPIITDRKANIYNRSMSNA
jgi:POT family proton-dependent oligopeptide transporter